MVRIFLIACLSQQFSNAVQTTSEFLHSHTCRQPEQRSTPRQPSRDLSSFHYLVFFFFAKFCQELVNLFLEGDHHLFPAKGHFAEPFQLIQIAAQFILNLF